MSDLISRAELFNRLATVKDMGEAFAVIQGMPTVERKKGKWLIKAVNTFELAYGTTGYEPVYECSICGGVEESYLRLDEPIMPDDANFPNYCPNCGADMRGEGHE